VSTRRRFQHLYRPSDEGHPTVSAIAPLVCFVLTLSLALLFRTINIYGATAARCVENDQFWYSALKGNWPLAGSLVLTLFLLFCWNLVIAFDDWKRSIGSRVVIVVNAVAIAAMLVTFIPLHGAAKFQFNKRQGSYDGIRFYAALSLSGRVEDTCATLQRFAGRWRVVERDIGHFGFDVAARWIELTPWGDVIASDASWQRNYIGYWQPPYKWENPDDLVWRNGHIDAWNYFSGFWDFDLQGDRLTLTTPEDFLPWYRSRIVLQRDHLQNKDAHNDFSRPYPY
jgi:hypothetical protein